MRFLLDQDIYAATARHLVDLGHDVVRAAELGLSRAADEELLKTLSASELARAFVVVEPGGHRIRRIR